MTGVEVGFLLKQMRQACLEVEDFIGGMSADDFLGDLKTQRAVEMTFVIIAEIADRLRLEDSQMPERLAEIPWAEIRGMRNRIVHGYLYINLNIVWTTAAVSIPQLKAAVERIVHSA